MLTNILAYLCLYIVDQFKYFGLLTTQFCYVMLTVHWWQSARKLICCTSLWVLHAYKCFKLILVHLVIVWIFAYIHTWFSVIFLSLFLRGDQWKTFYRITHVCTRYIRHLYTLSQSAYKNCQIELLYFTVILCACI